MAKYVLYFKELYRYEGTEYCSGSGKIYYKTKSVDFNLKENPLGITTPQYKRHKTHPYLEEKKFCNLISDSEVESLRLLYEE